MTAIVLFMTNLETSFPFMHSSMHSYYQLNIIVFPQSFFSFVLYTCCRANLVFCLFQYLEVCRNALQYVRSTVYFSTLCLFSHFDCTFVRRGKRTINSTSSRSLRVGIYSGFPLSLSVIKEPVRAESREGKKESAKFRVRITDKG